MRSSKANFGTAARIATAASLLLFASVSAAADSIEIFGNNVAGLSPLAVFGLLAAATILSEDLTAISAGVLASQGTISLPTAVAASAFGILVGDIFLFAAGRYAGRPALGLPLIRFFVTENSFDRSSQWLERHGMWAVFISRFVFGLRLPLCFAAGVLRTSFWRFSFFFALALAIWTPMIVGASYFLGERVVANVLFDQKLWLGVILAGVVVFFAVRLVKKLAARG